MFYYPNVLQRHTGCFYTIWLAATKGNRIVKREYLKVNVIKTCQKIVQYILQQVPPPYYGSPIPRLSLYLSAQLSYGVVCVYHRQCDILIEEMKNTLERLHKMEKQGRIDLQLSEQLLLLPDSLMLMQMLEDAPDPFFGMMEIPPDLPDPEMIPQISMLLETSGPDILRKERTPPRAAPRKRDDTDHLTSPEMITMREEEPALLQPVEFDQDLPEVSALDLELLMSDLPTLPDVETLPEPRRTREPPKERQPKRDRKTEIVQRQDAESISEIREVLQELQRERERLIEKERQTKIKHDAEREKEREERAKWEEKHQREVEREMKRLNEAIRDLEHLENEGAEEEILTEKQQEIENIRALQEEREHQWEAEELQRNISEQEREGERLEELERDTEWIREAEQEMERLREHLGMEAVKEGIPGEEVDVDVARRRSPEEKSRLPSEAVPGLEHPVLDEVTGEPVVFFPDVSPELQSTLHTTSPQRPSPQPMSPQLVLEEAPREPAVRPSSRRTGRRGGLVIDRETQIASSIMQEQTKDPSIYTQESVPVTLPHMRPRTPASLLESPTYEHFMAPELLKLWSKCAVVEPVEYIQERAEDSIDELEVVREATESGVSLLMSSEFSLEVSEEERSRAISYTPEERRALSVQEDRFLPMVSEMPEAIVEMPETEEILESDIHRNLHSQIENKGYSEFQSLISHNFSRLLVSKFFLECLVLCTKKIIKMEQAEPYGRIVITPGKNYSGDRAHI